jgi:hypothetical protein
MSQHPNYHPNCATLSGAAIFFVREAFDRKNSELMLRYGFKPGEAGRPLEHIGLNFWRAPPS